MAQREDTKTNRETHAEAKELLQEIQNELQNPNLSQEQA